MNRSGLSVCNNLQNSGNPLKIWLWSYFSNWTKRKKIPYHGKDITFIQAKQQFRVYGKLQVVYGSKSIFATLKESFPPSITYELTSYIAFSKKEYKYNSVQITIKEYYSFCFLDLNISFPLASSEIK